MTKQPGFFSTLARRDDLWIIILFTALGIALVAEALRGNT